MRALFRNRGFVLLLSAQIGLAIGDACMRMGLLEVFRRCQLNVEAETAKMFFALSLPGLVVGPLAMAYLDRWPRRRVMIFSDALRALLIAGIVVWLWQALRAPEPPRSLFPVYLLIVVVGTVVTFYLPARYAILPNLVPADQLLPANTALTASMAVIGVAGMPLGGLVAVKMGPLWAVLLNGLAYVVGVILISGIHVAPAAATTGRQETVFQELKTGLVYLWKHPTVMPLVAVAAAFAFLGGILAVTVVGYVEKTLELGTFGLGCLGGAAGIGGGIGIALLGRGRKWTRSIWLPPVQLVFGAVVLGLLSITREPGPAALWLVLLGAVGATAVIPIDAKLQEQVEDQRRGAVFAARGMFTSATMMVAFWMKFATRVLRDTPPPTVLGWCAAGAMLVALLTWAALRWRQGGQR